jgi:hypothetical protein
MEKLMITRSAVLAIVLVVFCGCEKGPQPQPLANDNQQSPTPGDVVDMEWKKLISLVEAKERKIVLNSTGDALRLRELRANLAHETEGGELASKYLPGILEEGRKRVAKNIQLQKQAFQKLADDDSLRKEQERMLGIARSSANSAAASIKKTYVATMNKSFASGNLLSAKSLSQLHAEKEIAIKSRNKEQLAAVSKKLDHVEDAASARLKEDKENCEREAMAMARAALQGIDKMNENLEETIRKNQGK